MKIASKKLFFLGFCCLAIVSAALQAVSINGIALRPVNSGEVLGENLFWLSIEGNEFLVRVDAGSEPAATEQGPQGYDYVVYMRGSARAFKLPVGYFQTKAILQDQTAKGAKVAGADGQGIADVRAAVKPGTDIVQIANEKNRKSAPSRRDMHPHGFALASEKATRSQQNSVRNAGVSGGPISGQIVKAVTPAVQQATNKQSQVTPVPPTKKVIQTPVPVSNATTQPASGSALPPVARSNASSSSSARPKDIKYSYFAEHEVFDVPSMAEKGNVSGYYAVASAMDFLNGVWQPSQSTASNAGDCFDIAASMQKGWKKAESFTGWEKCVNGRRGRLRYEFCNWAEDSSERAACSADEAVRQQAEAARATALEAFEKIPSAQRTGDLTSADLRWLCSKELCGQEPCSQEKKELCEKGMCDKQANLLVGLTVPGLVRFRKPSDLYQSKILSWSGQLQAGHRVVAIFNANTGPLGVSQEPAHWYAVGLQLDKVNNSCLVHVGVGASRTEDCSFPRRRELEPALNCLLKFSDDPEAEVRLAFVTEFAFVCTNLQKCLGTAGCDHVQEVRKAVQRLVTLYKLATVKTEEEKRNWLSAAFKAAGAEKSASEILNRDSTYCPNFAAVVSTIRGWASVMTRAIYVGFMGMVDSSFYTPEVMTELLGYAGFDEAMINAFHAACANDAFVSGIINHLCPALVAEIGAVYNALQQCLADPTCDGNLVTAKLLRRFVALYKLISAKTCAEKKSWLAATLRVFDQVESSTIILDEKLCPKFEAISDFICSPRGLKIDQIVRLGFLGSPDAELVTVDFMAAQLSKNGFGDQFVRSFREAVGNDEFIADLHKLPALPVAQQPTS